MLGTPGVPTKFEDQQLVMLKNGALVERDVLNIVEKISTYFPTLRVKYLDPDKSDKFFDAPYIITEMCPDGVERIVTQVWELNDSLFDSLIKADLNRRKLQKEILEEMDKNNQKIRQEQKRILLEENTALQEMVADVIRSPKDTYTATNPVTGQKHKFKA